MSEETLESAFAGTIRVGYIQDVNPRNNNYRIRIAGVPGAFAATGGSSGATYAPGGSLGLHSYAAGTFVLVYLPIEWPHSPAIVLQAIPPPWPLNEYINLPTLYHDQFPPKLPAFQSHKDSRTGTEEFTLPNQEGIVFPSGTKFLIDYMKAELKAGEKAGIEANVIDRMLRLLGWNYEVMTSGSFEKRTAEQGQYDQIHMYTPYLWEAKAGALQKEMPGSTPCPPRHVIFRGYLGDIEREVIQTPNVYSSFSSTENGVDDIEPSNIKAIGLFEQVKGVDGSFYLRSAKEIEIRKCAPFGALRIIREPTEYRYDVEEKRAGDYELSFPDYYPAGCQFSEWYSMYPYWRVPATSSDIDPRYFYYTYTYSLYDSSGYLDTEGALAFSTMEEFGGVAFSSIMAEEESSLRWDERVKSLENHPAWSRGTTPEITSDSGEGFIQLDHRGRTRYTNRECFVRMQEDGSYVIQAGAGDNASRLVMHPTKGILIEGPHITALTTVEEGQLSLGGESVQLSANDSIQIAAAHSAGIWGSRDGVMLQDPFKGRLLASRSGIPDTVDIELLSNDGTGWTQETLIEGEPNDGQYELDISDISTDGKVFRVRIKFSTETDADGNPITEYIESDVVTPGGMGGIEIRDDDPAVEDCWVGRVWFNTSAV